MKVVLIRHGETAGNREYRYVGTTDESVTPKGLEALRQQKAVVASQVKSWRQGTEAACDREISAQEDVFSVGQVYASPLRRCRETAQVFFPEQSPVLIENLRECDFGEFEYKNYAELNGNPDYQRFIDTMGESGFPGGEDMRSFQDRCVSGFEEVLAREDESRDIALVVHGGTIMALLDRFSSPHKDYYDWQVKNGHGYVATVSRTEDGIRLTDIESIG